MANILFVEDDEDLATTITDFLVNEKHTVETVHDGLECHEKLKANSYDIVLIDWDLPGLSGLEVLKRYRSAGGNAATVMLTARVAMDEKVTGLDSGADDYLTKPFSLRELSARLKSLLRRPGGRVWKQVS